MLEIHVEHRSEYRVIPVSVKRYVRSAALGGTCFGAHNHDSLEILLVREGAMNVKLNDETVCLTAGDAVLVNPYVTHSGILPDAEDASVDYDCLMLEPGRYEMNFAGSSFDSLLSEIRQGNKLYASRWPSNSAGTKKLQDCINRLKALFEEASRTNSAMLEGETMSEVYRLLALLASTVIDTPPELAHNRDLIFIRSIIDYISENYASPITGSDVCAAFGFSRRNFSRLIKRSFGTTFTQYLREYRVQRAAEEFSDSELSIPEIAAAVGFTDYCYFSRTFKSIIGISPARYFKRRQR